MGRKNAAVKIACENRKARHDYFIHEPYEAGLELNQKRRGIYSEYAYQPL